jgi:hypothetical protein
MVSAASADIAMQFQIFETGSDDSLAAPGIDAINADSNNYIGSITPYQNLEIEGTAPIGSTVTLYRDGDEITTTVTVDVSGNWTYTDDSLLQGLYQYTATDLLDGVNSPLSTVATVTVDLTPPVITITIASEITSLSQVVQVTSSDMSRLDGPVKLRAKKRGRSSFLKKSCVPFSSSRRRSLVRCRTAGGQIWSWLAPGGLFPLGVAETPAIISTDGGRLVTAIVDKSGISTSTDRVFFRE